MRRLLLCLALVWVALPGRSHARTDPADRAASAGAAFDLAREDATTGGRSVIDDQPEDRVAELLALERTVMHAIAAKDRDTLRPILADHFVLRMPGAPDAGKEQFLEAIGATPGEIETIRGEHTRAALFGDIGIVTGLQIATVRLAADGRVVTSRGAFTDVFERRGTGWQLVLAFSVELPADDSR